MKLKMFVGLIGMFSLITACSQEDVMPSPEQPDETIIKKWGFSEDDLVKGCLRVKFKEEPASDALFENHMRSAGIVKMTRTFPPAGKYEERTRREGLHLWYDVRLSAQRSVSRAAANLSLFEEVDQVAPIVKVQSNATRAIDRPFNDPMLPKQWFFHNEGNESWQKPGADISMFEAWEIAKGNPAIIVSMVDTGVDYQHPDLKDNIWVNEGEIPGNGLDDDGNGYVDDVHGYNFVDMVPQITPIRHGTHVAGLLAATNDNGLGVCGVAGGDGTSHSGVRLQISQIIENSGYGEILSSNIGEAIKYGADNGAVISQNSWGYSAENTQQHSYIDPTHKAAIDYFIKYAGCDNNGNQLPDSPMKGGIVLFASGNMNSTDPMVAAPADYEPVVGVAALGADFTKASYSNYGEYIDICAPGGLLSAEGRMWSTSVAEDDYYRAMSGTSMACPLVSGVAALVIQQNGVGKQGFTAEELKKILYQTATDISAYNPDYVNQLGAGCVNALSALNYKADNPDADQHTPVKLHTTAIADGNLVISVNEEWAGEAQIRIYSAVGAKVFEEIRTLQPYIKSSFDVSKISAGYYLLEYKTEKGTWKCQFIKY